MAEGFGGIVVLLVTLLLFTWYKVSAPLGKKGSVQIVVLGDIGRSPRMQYHALSLAQHDCDVQVIGYQESDLLPELADDDHVQILKISPAPAFLQSSNSRLFTVVGPLKLIWQVVGLVNVLALRARASEYMLIQNPPSIPVLLIAIIVCRIKDVKLVIDWHNFGYSILALKLGDDHPFVRISKVYEQQLARFAWAHITVTDTMRDVLKAQFKVKQNVHTLHDRPASIFQPLNDSTRAAFLSRFKLTSNEAQQIMEGKIRLVVSATSWTADEDFSVLLDALCQYTTSATSDSPQLPELLVIITGKGPQKPFYLSKIAQLERKQELEMSKVKTGWLDFHDYATLLGAADLGISLHTSSSGVDLPMKVVDMFGAGLPVLGYSNFQAWPELVQEGVNGCGFANAAQMAAMLKVLFDPSSDILSTIKKGAIKESERRWTAEWDSVVAKVLDIS